MCASIVKAKENDLLARHVKLFYLNSKERVLMWHNNHCATFPVTEAIKESMEDDSVSRRIFVLLFSFIFLRGK